MKDQIYRKKLKFVPDFKFNQEVSQVFEDMIQRSIPSYDSFIFDVGQITQWYFDSLAKSSDEYLIYDLGSSTLNSTLAIDDKLKNEKLKIYAVDNSEAMMLKAQAKLNQTHTFAKIQLINKDIREIEFDKHHICLLNFTLQFIQRKNKKNILDSIYQALEPNGLLILAEKINFESLRLDNLVFKLHNDFKKSKGYTDLEIEQNLKSLKDILHLENISTHLERMKEVGFSECILFRQSLNFASFIAIK